MGTIPWCTGAVRWIVGCMQLLSCSSFCLLYCLFLVGSDIAGAFVLLHEAETKLKRIVHDKFEAAIQNGDRSSVERYFFS